MVLQQGEVGLEAARTSVIRYFESEGTIKDARPIFGSQQIGNDRQQTSWLHSAYAPDGAH
jgi:hypothetical protein